VTENHHAKRWQPSAIWRWLIEPAPNIEQPERRRQSQLLSSMLLILIPLSFLIAVVPTLLTPTADLLTAPWFLPFLLELLILSVAFNLNRRGYYTAAAALTLISCSIGILYVSIPEGDPENTGLLAYLVLPVLFSSVLLSWRITILIIALNTAGTLLFLLAFPRELAPLDEILSLAGFGVLVSGLILVVMRHRNQIEQVRQRELAEKEERYRTLLETAFDGVVVAEKGRIVDANSGFAVMFDYPREELIGMPLASFWAEDGQTPLDVAAGTRMSAPQEATGIRRNGMPIPIEWIARAQTRHGRDVQVVAVRDIAAKKSLEEQLRQAQKMEAVGRLAGGIAHDFNNLLTAIIGYSHFILAQLAPDDPAREDVLNIRTAGERAATLTNQLLSFSRRQVVAPRVLDLNGAVRNIEGILQRMMGEDVRLETRLSPQIGPVKMDPVQVEQVIMNLAVNARDAMPQGGVFTIATAPVHISAAQARHYVDLHAGAYVELTVRDTGVGMDDAVKAHLFEPFFTTKEPGKGTGLGLSTVYGIIRQADGHIYAESQPGHGATFRIYIPCTDEEIVPERPIVVGPVSAEGGETLLVIEDEPILRDLARITLERRGYTVLVAADGDEALAVAQRYPGRIALAVADVVMPGMRTREAMQRLREIRPELRVLYMSGHPGDDLADQGILGPGIAFLRKPFTPDELARKVRETLDATPARAAA